MKEALALLLQGRGFLLSTGRGGDYVTAVTY